MFAVVTFTTVPLKGRRVELTELYSAKSNTNPVVSRVVTHGSIALTIAFCVCWDAVLGRMTLGTLILLVALPMFEPAARSCRVPPAFRVRVVIVRVLVLPPWLVEMIVEAPALRVAVLNV